MYLSCVLVDLNCKPYFFFNSGICVSVLSILIGKQLFFFTFRELYLSSCFLSVRLNVRLWLETKNTKTGLFVLREAKRVFPECINTSRSSFTVHGKRTRRDGPRGDRKEREWGEWALLTSRLASIGAPGNSDLRLKWLQHSKMFRKVSFEELLEASEIFDWLELYQSCLFTLQ